jgi:hypothetical protein
MKTQYVLVEIIMIYASYNNQALFLSISFFVRFLASHAANERALHFTSILFEYMSDIIAHKH